MDSDVLDVLDELVIGDVAPTHTNGGKTEMSLISVAQAILKSSLQLATK